MITVIKIGGACLDKPELLNAIKKVWSPGKTVIVHGGGPQADALGKDLGVKCHKVDGRRVTDKATLNTVIYAFLKANKELVSKLNASGVKAIGLTGADAELIPATKRKPEPVDYGYVGDVKTSGINTELLSNLLKSGYTPVISPITATSEGQLLNTNADTVASAVAVKLAEQYPVGLVYGFDLPGLMQDTADEDSMITAIKQQDVAGYKEKGIISGGMIPKIENACTALQQGVGSVLFSRYDNLKTGTTIT